MSKLINFSILKEIQRIETLRKSRVLVLAASNLELEILPQLYDQLLKLGKVERLDVVIHSRGGIVNAARRIALLLRQFTEHLCFIVPYYCESSATILTLAADEIIAGDLAIFTPIDPHLHGGESEDADPSSLSCLDIKMFGNMSENWFGVDANEAREQSLSLLCNSIFPPTLTAFYRTTLELQQIGEELINYQLPELDMESRENIVKHLMFGYHSHNYAITRDEMIKIGLKVKSNTEIERLAWKISQAIQVTVGGALRQSIKEPWHDMLIATSIQVEVRENRNDGFMPQWKSDACL
jgi:hypothetical protein